MISLRVPSATPLALHQIYALVRRGEQLAVCGDPALGPALRRIGLQLPEATDGVPLPEPRFERRLRVALLGHGNVGAGLHARLLELPDLFEVTGVAVRRVRDGFTNCLRVLERDCDVVVELIGGTQPAAELIEASLRAGRHVVTANKAVIAAHAPFLEALAAKAGVSLLYSASVGGAMPALETVRRLRVTSFSGVLNATSNYVLDRIAAGLTLPQAVAEAQQAGFAEADPQLDLDGTDAAQKLMVLSRAAFGRAPAACHQQGILGALPAGRVRLIASCDGERGDVRPIKLDDDHPLASCSGAENRLLIHHRDGAPVLLSAAGAGRWPTAEAVLADLLDLAAAKGPIESRRARASLA